MQSDEKMKVMRSFTEILILQTIIIPVKHIFYWKHLTLEYLILHFKWYFPDAKCIVTWRECKQVVLWNDRNYTIFLQNSTEFRKLIYLSKKPFAVPVREWCYIEWFELCFGDTFPEKCGIEILSDYHKNLYFVKFSI